MVREFGEVPATPSASSSSHRRRADDRRRGEQPWRLSASSSRRSRTCPTSSTSGGCAPVPEPRPRAGRRVPDPGEQLRAERRAERLLGEVLGAEALEAYRALGFLHCFGGGGDGTAYGYLIYPHKPIVSFDAATGELLNEHCVSFPDRSEPDGASRLPDADDVLAKWLGAAGRRARVDQRGQHAPARAAARPRPRPP